MVCFRGWSGHQLSTATTGWPVVAAPVNRWSWSVSRGLVVGYPPQVLAGCCAEWTLVTARPATVPVTRTVAEPAATDDARVLNDW